MGKTELLAHFCQEKRRIFFVADQVPEQTRDAIKLLGASVPENPPSKWSRPPFVRGVLPANAQTTRSSCYALSIVVTTAAASGGIAGFTPATDIHTAGLTYALGTGLCWNCGTGCIRYQIDSGGIVVLELPTFGHAPLPFTFPGIPRYILVDGATGDYAVDNGTTPPPGNCSRNQAK